jgi:hypothetical protein
MHAGPTYPDLSADELLAAARRTGEDMREWHQAIHLWEALDRRVSGGEIPPAAWRKPLLDPDGGVTEDTQRLIAVLRDELAEVELMYGGAFVTATDGASVSLESLAQLLAARLVRELEQERAMVKRLLEQQSIQQLANAAARTMDEVRAAWRERR